MMSDEDIVALYWKRDEEAIKQTKLKYEAYLMKIAKNMLKDYQESQEAVNDTYLAAWNSMPENRPKILSLYLGKLIRHISIDVIRKRTSKKRNGSEYDLSYEELDECLSDRSNPDDALSAEELSKEITAFLQTLSVQERVIFISRYYRFDSIKQIADRYHSSESAVKTMLHRTRNKLKEVLIKKGYTV